MQDAFDRDWWERVSGRAALSLTEVPQAFDLTNGGSCGDFSNNVVDLSFLIRHQIGRRFARSSPCSTHSHGNSINSIYSDEIAVIIHCVLDRRLSSRLGHISHFFVYIAHLVDCSRRGFCRAADNTGGVGAPICRTHPRRLVMERRGSLGPATQGREHEGMSSLGLVAPTTGRGEAEDSYPQAEHRPLDKRQTRLHTPNLFSASNDWPPGFIIGLERDYPSTVSTIAKTAGKLAPKGESGERCILCELWVVQYGSHLRPFTKRNNF
jgi:hypothetical protein